MTLEQIVETVLIRAYESQNESQKRLYRWEIEALLQGALARLFQRLQESGKSSKLLRTASKTTDTSGTFSLDSNFVVSSLEYSGDGHIWFDEPSINNYLPISYEPIYENRYLKRPMPGAYFYSIFPSTSGTKIQIYLGDGMATPPTGEVDVTVTGLFIPTNSNVSDLDVESTELLIEVLIEMVRERSMADQIPTYAPANVPTKVKATPVPQ